MRAAIYHRYGGADVVTLTEVPVPAPASRQMRVRIAAAGVNPLDGKLVRGDFRWFRGRAWPKRLGTDFAGAIDAIGPGVVEWRVGEPVLGSVSDILGGTRGAFAEHVLVEPGEVVRKPPSLTFAAAAALPIAGASALDCLELAETKNGSEVLVIGAAGGVGSFCVAAGSALGAKITAVCRADNEAYVRQLGAGAAILRDQTDPLQCARRFDAVIDAVGAYSFGKCAHLLKPSGIYVLTLPGPGHYLQMWRTRMFGGKQARALSVKVSLAHLEKLTQLAVTPAFRAIACTTIPLEKVGQALTQSLSGQTRGKLVLEVARA